jgi:hypothetical protein
MIVKDSFLRLHGFEIIVNLTLSLIFTFLYPSWLQMKTRLFHNKSTLLTMLFLSILFLGYFSVLGGVVGGACLLLKRPVDTLVSPISTPVWHAHPLIEYSRTPPKSAPFAPCSADTCSLVVPTPYRVPFKGYLTVHVDSPIILDENFTLLVLLDENDLHLPRKESFLKIKITVKAVTKNYNKPLSFRQQCRRWWKKTGFLAKFRCFQKELRKASADGDNCILDAFNIARVTLNPEVYTKKGASLLSPYRYKETRSSLFLFLKKELFRGSLSFPVFKIASQLLLSTRADKSVGGPLGVGILSLLSQKHNIAFNYINLGNTVSVCSSFEPQSVISITAVPTLSTSVLKSALLDMETTTTSKKMFHAVLTGVATVSSESNRFITLLPDFWLRKDAWNEGVRCGMYTTRGKGAARVGVGANNAAPVPVSSRFFVVFSRTSCFLYFLI